MTEGTDWASPGKQTQAAGLDVLYQAITCGLRHPINSQIKVFNKASYETPESNPGGNRAL